MLYNWFKSVSFSIKLIICDSSIDNNLLFKKNDAPDSFDNIHKVIYSSNESVFEFDTVISKYIVDNLKICKYIPSGYLFNNSNDTNMWSFKIVVITNKNIYAANRYIDEHKIGCF